MRNLDRFAGVDCGETHHVLVALDEHGQQVRVAQFANRREPIVAALKVLEEAKTTQLALESLYGFSGLLADLARGLGFCLWQVSSKALERYRDLEGQPHKDDERDAFLLARIAWQGLQGCRLALQTTPEEQIFRRLSRLHTRVTQQRKRAKLRLRSRLLERCPQVVSPSWEGPKWSSISMLAVLERWPGFDGLGRARLPTIRRTLQRTAKKEKIAQQAQALQALGCELGEPDAVLTLELSCLVQDVRSTSEQIRTIDAQIERHVEADAQARKLKDMPGIGTFTAAVLSGELRPLARHCSEAKVATYAGLTPLNRNSGKSKRSVLAKGVNKHAQQACYLSALASLRSSALDRAYYDKQRASHKGHPKVHVVALLALARQRLKVIYKLMTSDAVYDKERLISSHLARRQEAA